MSAREETCGCGNAAAAGKCEKLAMVLDAMRATGTAVVLSQRLACEILIALEDAGDAHRLACQCAAARATPAGGTEP